MSGFRTLPRSSGTSEAAKRMREAGNAFEQASKKTAIPKKASIALQNMQIAEAIKPTMPHTRAVAAIEIPGMSRFLQAPGPPPKIAMVAPLTLRIEDAYQRDLSLRSLRLIRHIVEKWDWAKFKPPIVAKTRDGLFVIDGQHTAIAATTLGINELPVLIVTADEIARRAEAFVAHNRDRLVMSPLQVFHAEVAANDTAATTILKIAKASGCEIPRYVPAKRLAKSGQASAISAMQTVFRTDGADGLARILRIAAAAQVAPIATTIVRALQILLKAAPFKEVATRSDGAIAEVIRSIPNIEAAAQKEASRTGQNRYSACAALIAIKLRRLS